MGGFVDVSFTVTNVGNTAASGIVDTSGFAGQYDWSDGLGYPGTALGTPCAGTLGIGASCDLSVRLTGATPGNPVTGAISLDYNNGVGVVVTTRDLTGVVEPAASLTIDKGLVFDYGTVATLSNRRVEIFTVTNGVGFGASAISDALFIGPHYDWAVSYTHLTLPTIYSV